MALADVAEFAALAAVTVTVCGAAIVEGAVYRPVEEIVPTGGLIDHVTPALPAPETVAANCCMPDGPRLIEDGLSETVTAWGSVITAAAVSDGFAMEAAVIVTVCVVGAVLGATYTALVAPLARPPKAGLKDQVTPVVLVPVTVAVSV